jgi:hypothetical protein
MAFHRCAYLLWAGVVQVPVVGLQNILEMVAAAVKLLIRPPMSFLDQLSMWLLDLAGQQLPMTQIQLL